MPILKIKKRNGDVVDFDRDRIETAIGKAFVATNIKIEAGILPGLLENVILAIEDRFGESVPGVESVQDTVERKLAEAGYFDVAKSYILYRLEHQQQREQESQAAQASGQLKVKKRDGTVVPFDVGHIERAVKVCARDYPGVEVEPIIADVRRGVYDEIDTTEINELIVMVIRARIELDPIYSKFASRYLFNSLYKDVIRVDEYSSEFETAHRQGFITKIKQGVEVGRLDEGLLNYDLAKLASELQPERDQLFHYLGSQTLYDRYFMRDMDQKILETPQYFWMRVAMGLALAEDESEREARAIEFYQVLSQLLYVASTPTLFHAGTNHPQMSSCYLTTVEDDLSHIFKSIGDNAQLSKWSGGLGNDWTNIRGTGSVIKSTNVGSQGVIPFLKIADSTTAAINRSGRRRGATCAYLETWHFDIESFLELRKNTGDERRRTHDMNTSNWIPDLFMKRVIDDGDWTLFSPEEVPDLHHIFGRKFEERYQQYEDMADRGQIKLFKKIRAVELWRKMITMLFETGHPWMTFKDPCNLRSPQDHVGVVHSSNLCTEITLNTSADETAVCNLGSIALVNHFKDGEVNKEKMEMTIKTAMRMLDNVVDLNFYPTTESKNANMRHRPVGLGIMGYQDLLYKLGLQFDSEEATQLSDQLMEFISYHAILSSSKLAKEKGSYSTYPGSKWERGIFPIDSLRLLEEERGIPTGVDLTERLDWSPVREHVKQYGMRNSNCMAIAPTATIANISGCLPSIEPIYKNIYVKSNFSGEFTVINTCLVDDLRELGLWSSEMQEKIKYYDGSVQKIMEIPGEVRGKYKEVFELDSLWIVRHAAVRGKWIDQSQSINIFSNTESGAHLSEIYTTAWKMGLKTTYYLRTLGATSIEKSTLDINKSYEQPAEQEQTAIPEVAVTAASTAPVPTPAPVRSLGAAAATMETAVAEAGAISAFSGTTITETVGTVQAAKPSPTAAPDVKLCRINDPDCEACQ